MVQEIFKIGCKKNMCFSLWPTCLFLILMAPNGRVQVHKDAPGRPKNRLRNYNYVSLGLLDFCPTLAAHNGLTWLHPKVRMCPNTEYYQNTANKKRFPLEYGRAWQLNGDSHIDHLRTHLHLQSMRFGLVPPCKCSEQRAQLGCVDPRICFSMSALIQTHSDIFGCTWTCLDALLRMQLESFRIIRNHWFFCFAVFGFVVTHGYYYYWLRFKGSSWQFFP